MRVKLSILTGRVVVAITSYNLEVGGKIEYLYSTCGTVRSDTYHIDMKYTLEYLIGISE